MGSIDNRYLISTKTELSNLEQTLLLLVLILLLEDSQKVFVNF